MFELLKVSENRGNGAMRDPGGVSFVCRVQYLNDLDPFLEYNVREPPRALFHTFNTTIPLSYQIAAVHRLLQAPHRVSFFHFVNSTNSHQIANKSGIVIY